MFSARYTVLVICLLPACLADRDIEGLLKPSRPELTATSGDVLASLLGDEGLNARVHWPTKKKCFPTKATELLFDKKYTSDFRSAEEEKIMAAHPKKVNASKSFEYANDEVKCSVELYQIEVGPVTNITLPEKVTLTDVDKGASLLGGDGTIISASNLLFEGTLRNKIHAHCSICLVPKWAAAALGYNGNGCMKWVNGCDVTARLTILLAGKFQVEAKECLDATLANVETCLGAPKSCIYANATSGTAAIEDLDAHVDQIDGTSLCSLTGMSKHLLNQLLQEKEALIVEHLNQVLADSFLETANELLREEGVRPYNEHPK
mmetsp:Transcript_7791/g.15934  ORF Transcript_7791/g.15934 Transcript_7791/m.15934 type:complete len:320 (-) Transcript_7791:3-962(-)